VLRRKVQKEEERLVIDDILTIDLKRFEVMVEKQKIELTSTEFRILQLLSSKQGWVFSRENILQHLWGHEKTVVDRTVDVHVRHLRESGRQIIYKEYQGVVTK
jgi:two-component system phosphate regulon response regulator PhoB/two-component system alkaline phosphatase synthesis response regulator PhoP